MSIASQVRQDVKRQEQRKREIAILDYAVRHDHAYGPASTAVAGGLSAKTKLSCSECQVPADVEVNTDMTIDPQEKISLFERLANAENDVDLRHENENLTEKL